MTYKVIAGLAILLLLVALALAAMALLDKRWIKGFLRGAFGFLMLGVAGWLALVAEDIVSYRAAIPDRTLATVSFRQKDTDVYQVELQQTGGGLKTLELRGEQWQLQSRMFRATPLLGAMGLRTGYRFDSIQGRYLAIDMNGQGSKQPERLSESARLDVWAWMNAHSNENSSLQAYMSTPGYIAMADGAIFEIVLTGTNLSVRPLNEVAKAALERW